MKSEQWLDGAFSEIEFWDVWIRVGRLLRSRELQKRLSFSELDSQAAALLPDCPVEHIRILDVGSGPFTGLGVMYKGHRLDMVAIDPLAGAYRNLFKKHGIKPPLAPKLGFVEDLAIFVPVNSFDLVVCENALDHSMDPMRGILQMLEVTKPHGHVLLRHFRNEARAQDYEGLHQWNLDVGEDGDFRIWNESASLSVGDVVGDAATVSILDSDNERIVVSLRKNRSETSVSSGDYADRLRDALIQMAEASGMLYRNDMVVLWYLRLKLYCRHAFSRLTRLFEKSSARNT